LAKTLIPKAFQPSWHNIS